MFGKDLGRYLRHTTEELDLVSRVTQHPSRPKPIRDYDQIYMLTGSQLAQAKLISDYVYEREVVMVGDGDCMALVLGVLGKHKIIEPPAHILVLDFDERILAFIREASRDLGLDKDLIEVERYNVRHPTPTKFRHAADVFYTNPPYGSADKGECSKVFMGRCMELCKPVGSWGVAILPYEHHTRWSRDAMANIQGFLLSSGYVVSEMIRGVHQYHLDDRPELFSGTVVVDRVHEVADPYLGREFSDSELRLFYGKSARPMPEFIAEDGTPSLRASTRKPTVGQQRRAESTLRRRRP